MYESDLSEERIVFGDSPAAPAKSSQNSSVITGTCRPCNTLSHAHAVHIFSQTVLIIMLSVRKWGWTRRGSRTFGSRHCCSAVHLDKVHPTWFKPHEPAQQPLDFHRDSGPEKRIHCRVQFQRLHGSVSAASSTHGLGTQPIDPYCILIGLTARYVIAFAWCL